MSVIHLAEGPALVGGALPQPPELLGQSFTSLATQPPRSSDLRAYAPRLEDQRSTNACCAESVTTLMEACAARQGILFDQLSPGDLWLRARELEGKTVGDNVGLIPSDAFRAAEEQGVGRDVDWKLEGSGSELSWLKPPPATLSQSPRLKIGLWLSIESDWAMKWALSQGFPVGIAMMMPDSTESAQFDGLIYPGGDRGRHMMTVFGHDDDAKVGPDVGAWKAFNSWGAYGIDGTGWCLVSYKCSIFFRGCVRRVS